MNISRVLVSVSNKEGLDVLAQSLAQKHVEFIASGGSAAFLQERGYRATPVSEVTGNPEAFGGRLKTLSFQIAAGLLFRRQNRQDCQEAQNLGVRPIDLVVCNLYPFEEVAKRGGDWEELEEHIDIGGVTLIRAGAKNSESVAVLTHPRQYKTFQERLERDDIDLFYRKHLALEAFAHTAHYDRAIACEWEKHLGVSPSLGTHLLPNLQDYQRQSLRYGENPHQKGQVYHKGKGPAGTKPLQGKDISWNNLLDGDAAWRIGRDLDVFGGRESQGVVVVKHASPCGIALGREAQHKVLERAWKGDSVSAFGSILCFSREVEEEAAKWLQDKFVEVIMAPSFSSGAKALFAQKKNLRLLGCSFGSLNRDEPSLRSIAGGYLLQEEDVWEEGDYRGVTKQAFDREKRELAAFGELACKYLKSNGIAIVYRFGDSMTLIGAGTGNPNRLVSIKQAVEKARENRYDDLSEAVLVSDGFFPFRDNIDMAHKEGIRYILQPGGSKRDEEVIDACNEYGIGMLLSGRRHFRH